MSWWQFVCQNKKKIFSRKMTVAKDILSQFHFENVFFLKTKLKHRLIVVTCRARNVPQPSVAFFKTVWRFTTEHQCMINPSQDKMDFREMKLRKKESFASSFCGK